MTTGHILLLGCGHRRTIDYRAPWLEGQPDRMYTLTTVDVNPDVQPDVIHDLDDYKGLIGALHAAGRMCDGRYDEIHAYEVFEHLGKLGDGPSFFGLFDALYALLVDGGALIFSCPRPDSVWAWGDPTHKRLITPEMMIFLDRTSYEQVGRTTMGDYRYMYNGDFITHDIRPNGESYVYFLQKRKRQ